MSSFKLRSYNNTAKQERTTSFYHHNQIETQYKNILNEFWCNVIKTRVLQISDSRFCSQ